MALNRWTILAIILLLSTAVGLLYLPVLRPHGMTPLYFTALGLTTLQVMALVIWPVLSLIPGFPRLLRSGRGSENLPVFTRMSAPLAISFESPLGWPGRKKDREYISAEYVFAGYQAVRILWWTILTQFTLTGVLFVIYALALGAKQSNAIFPPVFGVIVFLPFYVGIGTVLYTVFIRTYSDAVGKISVSDIEQLNDSSEPRIHARLTPYIGIIATGLLVVPLCAALYVWLSLDLA